MIWTTTFFSNSCHASITIILMNSDAFNLPTNRIAESQIVSTTKFGNIYNPQHGSMYHLSFFVSHSNPAPAVGNLILYNFLCIVNADTENGSSMHWVLNPLTCALSSCLYHFLCNNCIDDLGDKLAKAD
ncbi:hypothetical protein PVAP13_5NG012201 [Panicum virgatum]|uniref:Uncharacterized protein n=1 Tax=Panicum virgatum TaxID=38727 RepID=A0A8T0S8Q7_PANVG|nr:hypothetical protein PVAP13_5NG012201 [Panicum virgatum]